MVQLTNRNKTTNLCLLKNIARTQKTHRFVCHLGLSKGVSVRDSYKVES